MKKILLFLILIFICPAVFSGAGQRDTRGQLGNHENLQKDDKDAKYARMNPPEIKTDVAVIEKKPCPIDKIKSQLTAYCATVVCGSSSELISAIRLGGTDLSTIDDACQALVWQEIASRLDSTFLTFKSECDRMNSDYATAINEWKKKYDDMAEAQKKAKTQRNIAIGTGAATTVGAGLGGFFMGKKQ